MISIDTACQAIIFGNGIWLAFFLQTVQARVWCIDLKIKYISSVMKADFYTDLQLYSEVYILARSMF